MYKHVIWDFDGTLFDTYPVMAGVFKEMLQKQGIEEPLEEIISQMRVSASSAIKYYEMKYQIDKEFITEYKIQKKEAEMDIAKPFDEIEAVCKYIYTTNRKNYLLTHRGLSSIELLKKHGIYDYFTEFITSKQGFERKPSPAAINYLISKYNIIQSESLMIGDRDLDLLSGKNAGISACYFTEGSDENEYADYRINNFQQLYAIV